MAGKKENWIVLVMRKRNYNSKKNAERNSLISKGCSIIRSELGANLRKNCALQISGEILTYDQDNSDFLGLMNTRE